MKFKKIMNSLSKKYGMWKWMLESGAVIETCPNCENGTPQYLGGGQVNCFWCGKIIGDIRKHNPSKILGTEKGITIRPGEQITLSFEIGLKELKR